MHSGSLIFPLQFTFEHKDCGWLLSVCEFVTDNSGSIIAVSSTVDGVVDESLALILFGVDKSVFKTVCPIDLFGSLLGENRKSLHGWQSIKSP